MTDRPILFNAPMVQAILREIRNPGTGKTQTRRVLQFPPHCVQHYPFELVHMTDGSDRVRLASGRVILGDSPYPGDRRWVREAWRTELGNDLTSSKEIERQCCGEAGYDRCWAPVFCEANETWERWQNGHVSGSLRASMHMSRWASRLTLEVTEVRVHRLQDISEADANAEGLGSLIVSVTAMGQSKTARDGFQTLWDSLNGKPLKPGGADISWQANPWVVAVSFWPHFCNIDRLETAA